MTFKRWIPTFLAFPISGWIAIETIGSSDGPLPAALGGLLVGAAVGAAQWLALRKLRTEDVMPSKDQFPEFNDTRRIQSVRGLVQYQQFRIG